MSERDGGAPRFGRIGGGTIFLLCIFVVGTIVINVVRRLDQAGGSLELAWGSILLDLTITFVGAGLIFVVIGAWRVVSAGGLRSLAATSPSPLVYSVIRSPALAAAVAELPRSDFDQPIRLPFWLGLAVHQSHVDIVNSRTGATVLSLNTSDLRDIRPTMIVETGRSTRSIEFVADYHAREYRVPVTLVGYGLLGLFTPTVDGMAEIVGLIKARLNLTAA